MARNPFELPYLARGGIPYKMPIGRPLPRGMPQGTWSDEIGFNVVGLPAPKGSKSAKGRRKNGSAILVESAAEALGPWSERVERAARATGVAFAGPVEVHLAFRFRRPSRPKYDVPAVKPDGDKLDRAVWDALVAGGLIEDDARVTRWSGSKRYAAEGEAPGAYVTVRRTR